MSTIHSSWTLLGRRSLLIAGTARFSTVRSIAYIRQGSASTPSPIHSRSPPRAPAGARTAPLGPPGRGPRGGPPPGGRRPRAPPAAGGSLGPSFPLLLPLEIAPEPVEPALPAAPVCLDPLRSVVQLPGS